MRSVLLVLLLAAPAAAEVTVTPQGDRVSLRAVAAPLSDVLEQLSRATGMKVIYEGAAPRVPVTVTVEGRTPVQAVLAVMQGQGLNFGLRTDAAGDRVDRLLIAGQATASGGVTPSTPVPPARVAPESPVTFNGDELEGVEEEEEPEPVGVKIPPPAGTRGAPPAPAPAFQPPAAPSYPNSPFAPQPQPHLQAPAPQQPPPPEPEEEKELD